MVLTPRTTRATLKTTNRRLWTVRWAFHRVSPGIHLFMWRGSTISHRRSLDRGPVARGRARRRVGGRGRPFGGRADRGVVGGSRKEREPWKRKEGRKSLRYTLLEAPFQSTGNRSSRKRTAQLEVSSMSGSCQFMPMQS